MEGASSSCEARETTEGEGVWGVALWSLISIFIHPARIPQLPCSEQSFRPPGSGTSYEPGSTRAKVSRTEKWFWLEFRRGEGDTTSWRLGMQALDLNLKDFLFSSRM